MFYLIYKITNTISNKIYIGSHKTSNKNDGYMGSGKYLNRAYKKYGLDNFIKEILFVFDNAEEMYAKEAEIVNAEFLSEQNTYNLKKGGMGGFNYINSNPIEKSKHCSKSGKIGGPANWNIVKNNPIKLDAHKSRASLRFKRLHTEEKLPAPPSFKNKKHSIESKVKMSVAKKNKFTGTKNSQYNTCWIYSDIEKKSKKISILEIEEYISVGWIKGRKMYKD